MRSSPKPDSQDSKQQLLQEIQRLKPAKVVLYQRADEIALAHLFANVFENVVRYNATAKCWYLFDGKRWVPDIGDMKVETLAKQFAYAMIVYSGEEEGWASEKIMRLTDRKARVSLIADARDAKSINTGELDVQENLLNTKNGVLNLDDLTFIDSHDPAQLLSKVANAEYDPAARGEEFERFMLEIMEGNVEKVRYLQEIFGYSLLGTCRLHQAYILYGATTRNGKSTLTETIRYLMGDYGANIEPQSLAIQKSDARVANGDIARLNGVRFLQMSEPPKNMRFDAALLKKVVAGDTISARNLYERSFEYSPVCKLFINTNHLPVVADNTLFTSGRLKVITFERHFEESEQDNELPLRLRSPESLSGVLNWMIEGLRRYKENGNRISTPDSVRISTKEYEQQSDKTGLFIEDCFFPVDKGAISLKAAYEAYKKWCIVNGFGYESKRNFTAELKGKNLLAETATCNGKTIRNAIPGYELTEGTQTSFEMVFD